MVAANRTTRLPTPSAESQTTRHRSQLSKVRRLDEQLCQNFAPQKVDEKVIHYHEKSAIVHLNHKRYAMALQDYDAILVVTTSSVEKEAFYRKLNAHVVMRKAICHEEAGDFRKAMETYNESLKMYRQCQANKKTILRGSDSASAKMTKLKNTIKRVRKVSSLKSSQLSVTGADIDRKICAILIGMCNSQRSMGQFDFALDLGMSAVAILKELKSNFPDDSIRKSNEVMDIIDHILAQLHNIENIQIARGDFKSADDAKKEAAALMVKYGLFTLLPKNDHDRLDDCETNYSTISDGTMAFARLDHQIITNLGDFLKKPSSDDTSRSSDSETSGSQKTDEDDVTSALRQFKKGYNNKIGTKKSSGNDYMQHNMCTMIAATNLGIRKEEKGSELEKVELGHSLAHLSRKEISLGKQSKPLTKNSELRNNSVEQKNDKRDIGERKHDKGNSSVKKVGLYPQTRIALAKVWSALTFDNMREICC